MWHTNSNKPQKFKIDMGSKKEVSSFSFTASQQYSYSPKDFTIEGCDDDSNETNWNVIKTYSNVTDYTAYETTLFVLDNKVNYRYYRFNITADTGSNYVALYKIQFYN